MKAETLFRLIVLVILGCAFLLSGLYRNKKKARKGNLPPPREVTCQLFCPRCWLDLRYLLFLFWSYSFPG